MIKQYAETIRFSSYIVCNCLLLTKITAAQNEVAISYHRVRGLSSQAVIFAATIVR